MCVRVRSETMRNDEKGILESMGWGIRYEGVEGKAGLCDICWSIEEKSSPMFLPVKVTCG